MHENIFLNLEDFEQEYGIELPKDVSLWDQAIMQHIQKAIPTLAGYKDLQLNFNKIDEEKGYAIGSITVKTEKSAIQFPFVIKSFNLFPIDIFIDAEGKYRPATDERISAALFNPELSGELIKPENDTQFNYNGVANDMYPPSGGQMNPGRQSFASTSVLNAIMESAAYKIDKVAQCIKADPEIAINAKLYKKAAAFEKFLTYVPGEIEKTASVGVESDYYDIFQVLPTFDSTKVRVKMASSIIHNPVERVMDISQAEKLAAEMAQQGQPGMQDAMANQGQTIAPDTMGSNASDPSNYIDIESAQNMRPVDRPGMYQVMSVFGDKMVGYVFPTVLTFDMQPAQMKVFAGMGQMAMQEEIIGNLISTGNPGLATVENNKTYVFAYFGEKPGQALCMVPCQIMNITTVNGTPAYLAIDLLTQTPAALFPLEGLETFMPATPDMLGELKAGLNGASAAYFIPKKTLAIEVSGMAQLLSSPMEAIQIMQMGGPAALKAQQAQQEQQQQQQQQQQAGQQQAGAPAQQAGQPQQQAQPDQQQAQAQPAPQAKQASVMSRYDGRICHDSFNDKYWIESPVITKLAMDNLSVEDAKFTLIAAGASPDEVPGMLKQAKDKGFCKMYDLVIPVSEEQHIQNIKTASAKGANVKSMVDITKFDVYPELLKVAAMISDEEDVNTVLALNFLTPENMQVFRQYLPALEKTESGLAAMLMAIRLGEKNLDAKMVKECMNKVNEILNELRKIV